MIKEIIKFLAPELVNSYDRENERINKINQKIEYANAHPEFTLYALNKDDPRAKLHDPFAVLDGFRLPEGFIEKFDIKHPHNLMVGSHIGMPQGHLILAECEEASMRRDTDKERMASGKSIWREVTRLGPEYVVIFEDLWGIAK